MPDDRIGSELAAPKIVDDNFVKASQRCEAMAAALMQGDVVREKFSPYGLTAEFRRMHQYPVATSYDFPSALIEVKLHVEGAPLHNLVKRTIRPLSLTVPCGDLHIHKTIQRIHIASGLSNCRIS